MNLDKADEQLGEDRRKEIFLAIVEAQDHQMGVPQSRRLAIERFGITESQVRLIDARGLTASGFPC